MCIHIYIYTYMHIYTGHGTLPLPCTGHDSHRNLPLHRGGAISAWLHTAVVPHAHTHTNARNTGRLPNNNKKSVCDCTQQSSRIIHIPHKWLTHTSQQNFTLTVTSHGGGAMAPLVCGYTQQSSHTSGAIGVWLHTAVVPHNHTWLCIMYIPYKWLTRVYLSKICLSPWSLTAKG